MLAIAKGKVNFPLLSGESEDRGRRRPQQDRATRSFQIHAVTGLLEICRQSRMEDRRLCGQSKYPTASRGSVVLYLLQSIFTSGSSRGFWLWKGTDSEKQGMLSKEPPHLHLLPGSVVTLGWCAGHWCFPGSAEPYSWSCPLCCLFAACREGFPTACRSAWEPGHSIAFLALPPMCCATFDELLRKSLSNQSR